MAVTTIEHERVHIDFEHVKATGAATSNGHMHAQVMEPVSMAGASKVSLSIDWIAWKNSTTALKLEAILQQSNDGANWHTVRYTTGTTGSNVNVIPNGAAPSPATIAPYWDNVGMAFARVVLILDKTSALAANDGAVVKFEMTTSL